MKCQLKGRCLRTGALDADGVHTNTEDVDCEVCKGDLHLWAVVSPKCPGRATCAEHASALGCPVDDMVLLYRHAPWSYPPASCNTAMISVALLQSGALDGSV